MNVRAHMSMLFHLDKCIGCHTCSVACKNLWTDRKGAEYMWWNNVETRPGTGYPTQWENQERFNGGWVWDGKPSSAAAGRDGDGKPSSAAAGRDGDGKPSSAAAGRDGDGKTLHLRLHSKLSGLMKLFYNPSLPELDDYYEPFTFRYQDLFNAPAGDDQPTAIPVSQVTGEPMEIKAGPNWDDDLGGSNQYAWNDPSMADVPEPVREQMQELERVVFNYLPRICNHCLNPACVAACPSGAIYKRAEDGVVLVNENKCRAWRMCVAACPYKKVYYNWSTGKSEKCILCFPRLETGQAPACAHSCVGRIRYMGVLLYDADRIPEAAMVPDEQLIEAHRSIILDPFDPEVIAAARANGIEDSWISAAQNSPAYKFVKVWKMALPLHPEYRTMAMMYYIPPLSPVVSVIEEDLYKLDVAPEIRDFELFDRLDGARIPVQYLANLFSAGNEAIIRPILRKLLATRIYMRRKTVDCQVDAKTLALLADAGTSVEEVEAIYKLTTVPTTAERFVIPQYHRETAVEAWTDPLSRKGETGFGFIQPPLRGE